MFKDAVPDTPPRAAFITAAPSAMPVTRPILETLARLGVLELHVTVCPDITAPY